MAEKDLYIATLEKKLSELCDFEVNSIRKNQLASAADEAKMIKELADFVAGISVQKCGKAVNKDTINPQVQELFSSIKYELGEAQGSHSLPALKYDYAALEPHISGTIMQIHHTKHHQAYINNLNAACAKLAEATAAGDVGSVNALLPALKFNGGGHLNHTIFWTNMAPHAAAEPTKPSGELAAAIDKNFGSFQAFQEKFTLASMGVKGSGWAWLGYSKADQTLQVATCQNQDPLQMMTGLIPLLGLDVWEHAYYLQYKNLRAEYVKAFFNVIDWENVAQRYAKAGQE